jgi:MoxR-like ATPase
MAEWKIFRSDDVPHDGIGRLPPPPPWRDFRRLGDTRGTTYRPGEHEVEMVNAALYLRRPLLVTAAPGTGKSSLVYAVAHKLGLGPVLGVAQGNLPQGAEREDVLAALLRELGRS